MQERVRDYVAGVLRAELARQEVTQRQLAERIGRTQNWVWVRASGRVPCDVDDLAAIAAALNLSIADFFPTPERVA